MQLQLQVVSNMAILVRLANKTGSSFRFSIGTSASKPCSLEHPPDLASEPVGEYKSLEVACWGAGPKLFC